MFRSFGLSVPEDANIVGTVHNPLVTGLRVGQPAAKMFLLNKFFLLRLNIFVVQGSVLFNVGQSVDSKDVRFIHTMAIKILNSSVGGFDIFEIDKTVATSGMERVLTCNQNNTRRWMMRIRYITLW